MVRRNDPLEPPPDDTCDPVVMTSARLARQLLQCATDAAELATRIQGLAAYVDLASLGNVAAALYGDFVALGKIRGDVLTGKVPIVAGRDEAAGRQRYPLLERMSPATNGCASNGRTVGDRPVTHLTAEEWGERDDPRSGPDPEPDQVDDDEPLEWTEEELTRMAEPVGSLDLSQDEPGSDAWRSVPIEQLELSDHRKAEAIEQGILTAGALADWLESRSSIRNAGRMKVRMDAVREALDQLRSAAVEAVPAQPKPKLWIVWGRGKMGPFVNPLYAIRAATVEDAMDYVISHHPDDFRFQLREDSETDSIVSKRKLLIRDVTQEVANVDG